MNQIRKRAKIWFLMAGVMFVLCLIQSNLWYFIAGSLPAPVLWLNLILYVILHRGLIESLFLNYFLALVMLPFTSQKIGVLWLILFGISLTIFFLKKRVFWPGTRYFILASIVSVSLFEVLSYLLSHWFDSHPVDFLWTARMLEVFLTPVAAAPIFWGLQALDKWADTEIVPQVGRAE